MSTISGILELTSMINAVEPHDPALMQRCDQSVINLMAYVKETLQYINDNMPTMRDRTAILAVTQLRIDLGELALQ